MNKYISAIIFTITILFLSGCTTSYTSTTQVEDSGFILLKGNYNNTILYIDDAATSIDATVVQYELNGNMVSKFPISVGTHTIRVIKNDTTLINKKILLSNAQTVEIVVP